MTRSISPVHFSTCAVRINLPVALQSRIIGREEPDNIELAVQHEAPGVRSGEANLLEPRDRRVLCVEIPHQHSIGILWIAEDELILRVGQCFDRRAIAIGAHQFAGDADERAGQPQLKGWQRSCDFRQANAFAGAHVECIAQPRQIEREEVQRAVAIEQQRPLDQVRRAGRQRFAAADELVVLQQPRLGRIPKEQRIPILPRPLLGGSTASQFASPRCPPRRATRPEARDAARPKRSSPESLCRK